MATTTEGRGNRGRRIAASRAQDHTAAYLMLGGLACVLSIFTLNHFLFRRFGAEVLSLVHFCSIVLPIVVVGPLLTFLGLKIRELRRLNLRLAVLAETDPLTGLYNRAAFTERVSALLAGETIRRSQSFVALFVIDADRFKEINDRYGHQAGDRAIMAIAGAIRRVVRRSDIVGRLGGEEFAVAIAGTSVDDAFPVAERIRAAVSDAEFAGAGTPRHLSVSIGVSIAVGPTDFTALFRDADQRLYEAKNGGRNQSRAGLMGEASLPTDAGLPALLKAVAAGGRPPAGGLRSDPDPEPSVAAGPPGAVASRTAP